MVFVIIFGTLSYPIAPKMTNVDYGRQTARDGRDKLTALATIDVQWRKIRLELGAEEVYLNKRISAPKRGTNLRGWHSTKR